MIKVVPPKGWVPPESMAPTPAAQQPNSQAAAEKVTDSNFDFDDIDQLLAKPEQISSAQQATTQTPTDLPAGKTENVNPSMASPPNRGVPAASPTVRPRRKNSATAGATAANIGSSAVAPGSPANDSQPMLPNQNWESDKSKRQKLLLRILAAIVGFILLSGFVIAMMSSSGDNPDPLVGKQGETKNAQPNDSDPTNPAVNETAPDSEHNSNVAQTDLDNANADSQPSEASTDDPANLDSVPDPNLTESPTDPTSASPTASPTQLLPPDLVSKPIEEQTQPLPNNTQQRAPLLPSPFRNAERGAATNTERNAETELPIKSPDNSAKKQTELGMVDKIDKRMGDLAGLLEESGASLSELQDVATEASGHSLAGIPKYVIEKPGPIKSDLVRLKLNVGGLLFDETPLPVVVRELTSISGVPITIDARSLEAAGKEINQQVSATIQDTDLASAMDQILAPLGITRQTAPVGLKFTVVNSEDFETVSYSVAQFSGLDEQAKKGFLAYVQAMIEPEIWVRAQAPATIVLQDNEIVANCPANLHAQIKRLISKLQSANALVANPTDPAAINQTQTRSGAILPKLELPIETQQTIRTPIGLFLTKLQSKSGVTVVVDWINVAKEGWNPRTLIPGNIEETTAGETVRQLAQSMSLSVVVVDASTLMLTTVEQAAVARDIEVYPVAKLLAGKFAEDQLKEAFETTLGFELRSEKYVYDSNCQCFVVMASQSKQRQVEALIKRLEGI